MPSYTGEVTTDWPVERAYEYLADFANVSEWDPTLDRSRLVSGVPREVGARYEIDTKIAGRTVTLEYEVKEAEPPNRIKLVADHDHFRSEDTLSFEHREGKTHVTYEAEIEMKGVAKLAGPPLHLAFQKVGRDAEEGLQSKLDGPVPS